jgi:hypothetical protein
MYALWVRPEQLSDIDKPEYATSFLARDALSAKRIALAQKIIEPALTKHAVLLAKYNGLIYKKFKKIIDTFGLTGVVKETFSKKELAGYGKNMDKEIIYEIIIEKFLDSVRCHLPEIPRTEDNTLKAAYDEFKMMIESEIDLFLSTAVIPVELAETLGDGVGKRRDGIKALILREWLTKNNYLTELSGIFDIGIESEHGSKIFTDYIVYLDKVTNALAKDNKKSFKKYKVLTDKYMKSIEQSQPQEQVVESTPEGEVTNEQEEGGNEIEKPENADAFGEKEEGGDITPEETIDNEEPQPDEPEATPTSSEPTEDNAMFDGFGEKDGDGDKIPE